MATNIWQGGAAAIAQVDTVQITGYDAATTYILTIGDKTIEVLGTTDVDGTAAALSAAWNLSGEPEVKEVVATVATDTLTLTASATGTPNTVTSSVTGGAGTIGAVTAVTANSGPNDASVDTNWSTNSVPGADDIVFENSSVACLYGLNQLGNILTYTQKSTFLATIGLPRENPLGYVEYRPTKLALGTAITNVEYGQGDGNGSGRTNLAIGDRTTALAINIHKSGVRTEPGIPALLLTTGSQSNTTTVTVNRGDLGIAFHAGETAVIQSLNLGYVTQPLVDAKVMCGDGVTLTTVTKSGGALSVVTNVPTFTTTGGTASVGEAATVGVGGATNVNGGTLFFNSSGDLDNLIVDGGGTLDFRQDTRSRTVVNAVMYQGAALHDPAGTAAFTNGIDLVRCGLPDVTLDIGQNFTLSKSAI